MFIAWCCFCTILIMFRILKWDKNQVSIYNLFQQVFIHFSIGYVSLVSSCIACVRCMNKSFRIIFTMSVLKLEAVVRYLEIGHILRFLSWAVKCHFLVLQHFSAQVISQPFKLIGVTQSVLLYLWYIASCPRRRELRFVSHFNLLTTELKSLISCWSVFSSLE